MIARVTGKRFAVITQRTQMSLRDYGRKSKSTEIPAVTRTYLRESGRDLVILIVGGVQRLDRLDRTA
jgi:hypothetical protein